MKLELDNVTMADVTFEISCFVPVVGLEVSRTIIRDTTISRSIYIYNNSEIYSPDTVLIDKSFCIESNITNTRLVSTRIKDSTILSSPNNYILNTVTILTSKLEINKDLIEKFILEAHRFEESYEIIQEISSGKRWYVSKDGGLESYLIRLLDNDGIFTGENLIMDSSSLDKMLRDGWEIIRDRMELTFGSVKGIHSGKRPPKRLVEKKY
jgi:hypothetical protein